MALLVATQYMARVNPEVADRAVELTHGKTLQEDGEKTHGVKTINFLFSCGSGYLKASNFSGAAMAARSVLLLSKAFLWRPAITNTVNKCLQGRVEVRGREGWGCSCICNSPQYWSSFNNNM